MVEGNSPDRDISDEIYAQLKARQESFVDNIIKPPSRGALVHSLTWTYQSRGYYEGSSYMEIYERRERIWKAFELLDRVERLVICSFMGEDDWLIPSSFFSNAKSIRIGGKMPYAFFRALIASPGKIVSLELDNPQGLAQTNDGMNSRDVYGNYPLYPLNLVRFRETEDDNHLPLVRHGGPMRGHLRPLVGRFTHLKHLYLRTVGYVDSTESSWSETREKARYGEMADFISSVSSTLTSPTFQQGPKAGRDQMPADGPRLMDSYFASHILPCLMKGPWPELKVLSICGIHGQIDETENHREDGRSLELVAEGLDILSSAEELLRVALGAKVVLNWMREVGSSFYFLPGSNHNDPSAWE